jgi:hypothetical protein
MANVAAHPTLIVALGDAAAPVLELLRALDDGVDLAPERGLRVLLEHGRGSVFGDLVAAERPEMAGLVGSLLAELRESACAQVVAATSGLRLVVVCDEGDLRAASDLLARAWATPSVRDHCKSLEPRGGVQVRLVIGCEEAGRAIEGWRTLAEAADLACAEGAQSPQALPIAVARKRDHRRLETPAHVLSLALVLRVLVLAATQDVEEVLNFSGCAAREWMAAELVDLAKSMDEERRRQRFGVWLEGLISRRATQGHGDGELPTTELLRQAVGSGAVSLQALQEFRDECDALTEGARRIAVALAASSTDSTRLGDPHWPTEVQQQLHSQLAQVLSGRGEATARKFAAALDDQEQLDRDWIDHLHERLGYCGTAALWGRLDGALAALTQASEQLHTRPPPSAGGEGGLASALASEQSHWQREIGPAPPGFLHWMALPWLAMGAASAPMWHAVAVEYGPVNPAVQTPLVQQLHRAVQLVAHSDWTVGLAALCGLLTWAAVGWWQRRNWRRAQLQFVQKVTALLVDSAIRRGGPADRERQVAWARAVKVMQRCASTGEYAVQRAQQQVRRSEPVIRWLVRRVQGRRHPIKASEKWSIDVDTPEVSWHCVPPLVQEEQPVSQHVSVTSPWQDLVVAGGPLHPEKLEALLLNPGQVREIWEKSDGSLPADQSRNGPAKTERNACELKYARPARLHSPANWLTKVFQLCTQRLQGELVLRFDENSVKDLLAPDSSGEPIPVRCSSESLGDDRLVVLQQAILADTGPWQGGE